MSGLTRRAHTCTYIDLECIMLSENLAMLCFSMNVSYTLRLSTVFICSNCVFSRCSGVRLQFSDGCHRHVGSNVKSHGNMLHVLISFQHYTSEFPTKIREDDWTGRNRDVAHSCTYFDYGIQMTIGVLHQNLEAHMLSKILPRFQSWSIRDFLWVRSIVN